MTVSFFKINVMHLDVHEVDSLECVVEMLVLTALSARHGIHCKTVAQNWFPFFSCKTIIFIL